MFRIDNNRIWLTRGDSAEFRPIIQEYEAQEGDKIVFSMKKAVNDDEPALRIETDLGKNIEFLPELTKDLSSGSYIYDLKIVTAENQVSTFVNGERFDLLGEIDNERN